MKISTNCQFVLPLLRNPGLSNFTNGLNQIIARENNFVNIIDTGFTLGTDNRGEAFRFWTELIEKYRHIFITRK